MEYEGTVYRPPSEARSLIIQVTVGCAHNRCTFCNMYRVKKFRVRTKEEIMKDLDECRDYYGPYVSRVFFADGDALVVKTELLLELLAYVHKNFPYVERITSYGTAKDVLAKSEEDLKALAAAGLEMVYIGAESGDDRVLEHIHKDVTAAQIAAAGQKLKRCGIKTSVTLISGLGDFVADSNAVTPEGNVESVMLREHIDALLGDLKERERQVIVLRFGLEDGHPRTLEEVGKEFNVTRERIRQIEAKALRKLRNPVRSKRIRDFL